MGVTMWGFPAPEAFEKNHIAMGLTEMLVYNHNYDYK